MEYKHSYIVKRQNQALLLEGELYSIAQIKNIAKTYLKNQTNILAQAHSISFCNQKPFDPKCPSDKYRDLFLFLNQWFDDNAYIQVKTSGSTGEAKVIEVEKDKMINSAIMTCSFFELVKKNSALLCMPLQYIGSKMLVVRALVAQLDLYTVPPSSKPLEHINRYFDFVPMTPQQIMNCFEHDGGTNKLNNIKYLLLGGMAVSKGLEQKCAKLNCHVWSSYGMTETLSHIALRKVNSGKNIAKPLITNSKISASYIRKSPFFHTLAGVSIKISKQNTLIIHAPKLCDKEIQTNDIANINNDGTFTILGRLDNVINSGGIKIPTEALEEELSNCLQVPLQVTSIPHPMLGEMVVLLLEKEYNNWQEKCQQINKYWKPKQAFVVQSLPKTPTHKPDRKKAKELALKAGHSNLSY